MAQNILVVGSRHEWVGDNTIAACDRARAPVRRHVRICDARPSRLFYFGAMTTADADGYWQGQPSHYKTLESRLKGCNHCQLLCLYRRKTVGIRRGHAMKCLRKTTATQWAWCRLSTTSVWAQQSMTASPVSQQSMTASYCHYYDVDHYHQYYY